MSFSLSYDLEFLVNNIVLLDLANYLIQVQIL